MVVVSEGVAFLKSRCIKNPVSGLLNSETHGISRAVAHSTRITVAYKSRTVIVDSLPAPPTARVVVARASEAILWVPKGSPVSGTKHGHDLVLNSCFRSAVVMKLDFPVASVAAENSDVATRIPKRGQVV